MSFSAIILSAGKSSRLGIPKAILAFDSQFTFLQKLLIEYLDSEINEIVLVISEGLQDAVKVQLKHLEESTSIEKINIITNPQPERGKFSSLNLALRSLKNKEAVFIQNIDNPFTTSHLLQKMIPLLENKKYVAPVFNQKRGHPVLVSKEILEELNQLNEEVGNLRDVLLDYDCNELWVEDQNIHVNINTKEEYQKYFAHAAVL